MCRDSNTVRVGLEVYFVVRAVRGVVVIWFIPVQSGFIPIHSWFIPIHVVFIPIQAAFIPTLPVPSKQKDPEIYLGLNFFLFISVHCEVVYSHSERIYSDSFLVYSHSCCVYSHSQAVYSHSSCIYSDSPSLFQIKRPRNISGPKFLLIQLSHFGKFWRWFLKSE